MKNLKELEKKMNSAIAAELTDEEYDAMICENLTSLKENNPVAYNELEEKAEADRKGKLPYVEG